MQTAPPPRRWYRPSTWRVSWTHLLPWMIGALLGLLIILAPTPPTRPPRLDVETFQEAQAQQTALLQSIQDELRRIRELIEQRR